VKALENRLCSLFHFFFFLLRAFPSSSYSPTSLFFSPSARAPGPPLCQSHRKSSRGQEQSESGEKILSRFDRRFFYRFNPSTSKMAAVTAQPWVDK